MRVAAVGILCWLVVGAAWAGNDDPARSQIEATMTVSGSLGVDDTGRVTTNAVDHPEQLPPSVVQLVQQTLSKFRFQPVMHDGHAQAVQTQMRLVVAANKIDPKHVAIRIRSAHFTESNPPPSEMIAIEHRAAIRFPVDAMTAGVGGTVYVAVRIDRSGHVVDAEAQQVNLRVVDSERQMRHWREALAKPTLASVKKYTFKVPSTGPHAGDEFFTGILPVIYLFDGQMPPEYGKWDSYVPGPRQDIAWLDQKDAAATDNEAIPDGTFAQVGTSLILLTPLDG